MTGRSRISNDVFRAYLDAPLLTRKEEMRLGALAAIGDRAARDKLILSYGRMVGALASKRANTSEEFDDMLQEGLLAMLEHASQYNPSMEVLFGTYLRWWVSASIHVWRLKNDQLVKLPHQATRRASLVRRIYSKFEAIHGRSPTTSEVAHLLGKSEKKTTDMLLALETETVYMSQDIPQHEDATVGDSLVDHGALTPEEAIIAKDELKQAYGRITDMLVVVATHPKICARDRDIFRRCVTTDPKDKVTLKCIGDEFGLSHERIRQIVEQIWFLLTAKKIGWKDNPLRREAARIEILQELV